MDTLKAEISSLLLTYWPSQGWVKSDKNQMSFAWWQSKKEQVLRGENKVKFVHLNTPWPHLASWDLHSLSSHLLPSSAVYAPQLLILSRVCQLIPPSALVLSLPPSLLLVRS